MPLTFTGWPSTPRLNRAVVLTEKIDGTNAAVIIEPVDPDLPEEDPFSLGVVMIEGVLHYVGAQSRKRLIKPGDDNYGFAAWVEAHRQQLAITLGPGIHYGEWWGGGIQRGYGFKKGEKFFSLFNVARYGNIDFKANGLDNVSTVPILAEFPTFDSAKIEEAMASLKSLGSYAVPEYANPEGLIVFHSAGRRVYKYLCESDEMSKTEAGLK